MDDLREAIERLTVSLNKIDGLYYMGAKKLGVKDSALSILYVLNDGKSHSQKQISDEWLIPKPRSIPSYVNGAEKGLLSSPRRSTAGKKPFP